MSDKLKKMANGSKIEYYKEKFKHLDPRDLQFANLLTDSKANGFNCPFCGNGTGDDGTGVKFELLNDGYKGYCFKCGRYFDVFDLIAEKYRFNVKTQFHEVLEKAAEIFGSERPFITEPTFKPAQNPKPIEKKIENFTSIIEKSWAHLDAFFANKKDWRGLTKTTLTAFGCGYLPNWFFGGFASERIIIPTSANHYLARYVGEKEIAKQFWKIHRGSKEIFGASKAINSLNTDRTQPIFAVEGEVDAMTIYQCGFTAIAFSGSDITARQQALLNDFPEGSFFVLMLDNDETGKMKSEKCAKKIRAAGFNVCEKFLDGDGDFNDLFLKNPDALKIELQKIFDDAKKFFAENPLPEKSLAEIPHDYTPPQIFDDDDDVQETQVQIPSCPINLAVPKNFVFKPAGIFHKEKSKDKESKGETFEVLDSSTPIVPTRIFQKKDLSGKTLELAFYERTKDKWHKIQVPATTIAKTQNITDLADFGVDINTTHARAISDFLSKIQHSGDNLKKIPRVTLMEKTGWLDDACEKFIYPPEGILNDEHFAVTDGGFNYAEKFNTAGTKNEWYFLFYSAYVGENCAWCRYALGLVLAAPLVKICASRNWQGILVAPSGSAKSAVAKLAISIFGNPEKYHIIFNGTNKALDELGARLNDLPCWIDEFQSADETVKKKIAEFIYNYAEGKTRARLTKNADMRRTFEFSGTRLCTSEEVILKSGFSQGAVNRIIQLKNFKPLPDDIGRELHKGLSKNFGHYGKMFIEYVCKHKAEIRATFDNLQKKFSKMNFIPHHLQQISLVYTALEFFWQMLKQEREEAAKTDEGAFWKKELSPLEYLDQCDINYFREILPTPQESNNIIRGRMFLAEILVTYSQFFDTYSRSTGGYAPAERQPALGCKFSDDQSVAFYPKKIGDFLLENGFPPAVDLMEGLKRENLLELPKSGKGLKKPERIGNKGSLWVFVVKKEALEFDP